MRQKIELKDQRGPREKHFLLEDGTMEAQVYDADIHYLKDGSYEEINNDLVFNSNYYQNQQNDFTVFFPKQANQHELMKLKKDSFELTIGMPAIQSVPAIQQDRKIRYDNLLEGMDLIYDLLPTKVKESIILKEREKAPSAIAFSIQTDLDLELTDQKTIQANHQGTTIFTLEAPYMIDQKQNKCETIHYQLEEKRLLLFLDYEWLQDPERSYPIIIDPTITNTTQDNNVYDTYIYPNDTAINRNQQGILKMGVNRENSVDTTYRSLLKFELPTIGTGSQIIDAKATLIGWPQPNYALMGDVDILDVHRITKDWTEEEANWNSMHDQYDPKIAACFELLPSYYNNDLSIRVIFSQIDLTNLVKKWYAGTPNYGVLIKAHQETYKADKVFATCFSKNNQVQGDNPKPFLVIHYRNQNGLESYMTYQEQNFTYGTSFINNYNGNLTTSFELNQTIGGKAPITLQIISNTNDVILNHNFGYGLGNQLNFHQTIEEVTIDGKAYLAYRDGDGTTHYFYLDKDRYIDEDGLSLSLKKENEAYQMTDKEGNQSFFSKYGTIYYLTKNQDVEGNQTIITYDQKNRIQSITDANKEQITLTYTPSTLTIKSPNETSTVTYENNKITTIHRKSGTVTFTYENNKIKTITDTNFKKLTFDYYPASPYRIKKVTELGLQNEPGNFLEFQYGFEATTIKDQKNRYQTYLFNSVGNTVGITDLKGKEEIHDAYGKTNVYFENQGPVSKNGRVNKLLSEQTALQYVNNYLDNTTFEEPTIPFQAIHTDLLFTEEKAVTGTHSLKVICKDANQGMEQEVTVPKGTNYTFSGFLISDQPLTLSLSYQQGTERICETHLVPASKEWIRRDLTIFYSKDATSTLKIQLLSASSGTFYLDDVQLEEGNVANYYNLISNSDFKDGLAGWKIEASEGLYTEPIVIPSNDEIITLSNQKRVLKLNSDPMIQKTLKRELAISGKKGDHFQVSFWYNNQGINSPLGNQETNNVLIRFHYSEEDGGTCIALGEGLHLNDEEWQFFSRDFVAEYDYSNISFIFFDLHNANQLYLTNFALYKELEQATYAYDDYGNLITSYDPYQKRTDYAYDKNNQLVRSTDSKGTSLYFEYDNQVKDRLLKGISESGITNELTYDAFGNPTVTRVTARYPEVQEGTFYLRAKGTHQYLDADFFRHTVLFQENSCSHDIWQLKKKETYYEFRAVLNPNYALTVVSDSLLLTKEATLFELIRLNNGSYRIKQKDQNAYLTLQENTIILKPLDTTLETQMFYFKKSDRKLFLEQVATYTDDGKFLTSVTDSLFHTTTYQNDPLTGLVTMSTDPNGTVTSYEYDAKEQLKSVTKEGKTVSYDYNAYDLLKAIHQGTKEYQFEYDSFFNQTKIGLNGHTLIEQQYEPNHGPLKSSTYGNGDKIHFTYDSFDRIKTIQKGTETYHHFYDNLGNLAKIERDRDQYRYYYDTSKRLKEYHWNSFVIRYGYDAKSNVIQKQYTLDSDHNVHYEYDKEDLLTKLTFDDQEIHYRYDELGRLEEKQLNPNFKTQYHYVTNGKRTSFLVDRLKNKDDEYCYSYDKLNNITDIYYNNNLLAHYHYDVHGELIEELDYSRNRKIIVHYDEVGNILDKREYSLDSGILLKENQYEYGNLDWEDQLTKFNQESITYDAIGNPLTIGTQVLTWENGRQLKQIQNGDSLMEYQYDKDGIRTKKLVNGIVTNYYLENEDIILAQTGNDVLYFIRDKQNSLVGFTYNHALYYYVKNAQEDIVQILDSTSQPVVFYDYDAWGNLLSIKDQNGVDVSSNQNHIGVINPYRYRSYYFDQETGYYYLNSRYYNPIWGRFLNVDEFIAANQDVLSHNLYIYCSNNPILYYDSSGQAAALALAPAAAFSNLIPIVAASLLLIGSTYTAAQLIETIQANKQTKTKKEKQEPEKKQHYVYALSDPIANKVQYVGRTTNLQRRSNEHRNSSYRKNLVMTFKSDPLSYAEARGLEQTMINRYQTLNRKNPANNQINGISLKNPRYAEYMNAVKSIPLLDTETYVGG